LAKSWPSYSFNTKFNLNGHYEHTCGCAETHEQEMHHICETCKEKKKVNPWAVCSSSVGRRNKTKYERCVRHVKKQQGMK